MITDHVVAVDTGGTFTDVVAIDADSRVVALTKVSSTPEDPGLGIDAGFRELAVEPVDAFLYGTTIATNALLQRRGARTALLVTQGFRDILELGRQNRPSLYDWFVDKPKPLVPRELCFEISERTAPEPSSCRPLDEDQARAVIGRLRGLDVDSVAISLLHSYRSDASERRLAALVAELLPDVDVSLSSDVLPEIMEFERTSTTAANAYLSPVMKRHLRQLVPRLRAVGLRSPVFLMQSDGGLGLAETTAERAVQTVLSGPAAGVIGGLAATGGSDKPSFLTIDMGGTSFDIAYAEGRNPTISRETLVSGVPISVPALDIHTLGAGGGSIAWIDAGGVLRVGPTSAGAEPGPACYGRGGELPTVTDANLLLGRLGADLLGGRLALDVDAAARAMELHVAKRLGLDVVEAARGVIDVVNAAMAKGMHLMSVARGREPESLGIVGFGGAGPLHACHLAAALGSDEVIIPSFPGATSAIGLAFASVRRERSRAVLAPLRALESTDVAKMLAELGESVVADLVADGIDGGQIALSPFIRLSYEGQRYQLELAIAAADGGASSAGLPVAVDLGPTSERFEALHLNTYGYVRSEPLFVFSLAVVGTASPSAGRATTGGARAAKSARKGGAGVVSERRVWFDDDFYPAAVVDRAELGPAELVKGPAIVEQFDSTVVVPPTWSATVDPDGNLLARRGR